MTINRIKYYTWTILSKPSTGRMQLISTHSYFSLSFCFAISPYMYAPTHYPPSCPHKLSIFINYPPSHITIGIIIIVKGGIYRSTFICIKAIHSPSNIIDWLYWSISSQSTYTVRVYWNEALKCITKIQTVSCNRPKSSLVLGSIMLIIVRPWEYCWHLGD